MSDTTETDVQDFREINARVVDEFRQNQGKVGGRFEGSKLAILHTIGAKSGQERLSPLAYLRHHGRIYVFAAGPYLQRHPDWYFNLLTHPEVRVEIGAETFEATARVLDADARLDIWHRFVAEIPQLPGWQRDAQREFPIIELTRKDD